MPWTIFEQRLLDARNRYAYPLVFIERLVVNQAGNYVPIPSPQPLQFLHDWEGLHYSRLRSQAASEALLGVVSIAYWGFYAGSAAVSRATAARALVRATWAANGRPRGKAGHPGPNGVQTALKAAATHLAAGAIENAIRAVSMLPEFGQLSFASKVLTAMAPEQCGVYDSIVSQSLKAGGWTDFVVSPNQGGITGPKANVYARWCRHCMARAAEMNSHGPQYGWDYHGIQQRPWRAVDVERAFFQDQDVGLLGYQTE